jgi:hypothetical protein
VDQAVSTEVLQVIQPIGIEAAIDAITAQSSQVRDHRRQIELALQQACYESDRARRQYDAVEPENRIVAAELERRWNERLLAVRDLEAKLQQIDARPPPSLSEQERSDLMMLGTDLAQAWHHPAASADTRKRILRTVLVEIIASIRGNEIDLILHWQGGDHTELKVIKARSGEHRWILDAETTAIIRDLARVLPDWQIASVLNRAGKRTGRDNTWTEPRVRAFRNDHDIAVYRQGERAERGELTLIEAAQARGTSMATVQRLITKGLLQAQQACKGAPWVIKAEALAKVQLSWRRVVAHNSRQNALEL